MIRGVVATVAFLVLFEVVFGAVFTATHSYQQNLRDRTPPVQAVKVIYRDI